MSRKPVQVSVTQSYDAVHEAMYGEVIAICDDGSVWRLFFSDAVPPATHGTWERLPDIPQEDD